MAQVTLETDTDTFLDELRRYADGLRPIATPRHQDFQRLLANAALIAFQEDALQDFLGAVAAELPLPVDLIRHYVKGIPTSRDSMMAPIIKACAKLLPGAVADARQKRDWSK